MIRRLEVRAPALRASIWLDSAFEFTVAVLLIAFRGPLGDWFGIGSNACVAIGIIFAIAGVALVVLARQEHPDRDIVRGLALANIAGGLAGWAIVLALWPHIDVWGRTALGAASDLVVLIGVVELVALRRTESIRAS